MKAPTRAADFLKFLLGATSLNANAVVSMTVTADLLSSRIKDEDGDEWQLELRRVGK